MSQAPEKKDLIVLVADSNMERAVKGILARHKSLNTRPITFDIMRHPQKDPGCRSQGVTFLAALRARYANALLIFDREGCGSDDSREKLESDIEAELLKDWEGQAVCIVIDPELEAWVWSDSPHVADALGWKPGWPDLRSRLEQEGLLAKGAAKPGRPKEAMELVLREVRKPRSSAIYGAISRKVSLARCEDASFGKLKSALARWFPC